MSDDRMMTLTNLKAVAIATDADREIQAALEQELIKLRPIFLEEGGDARIISVNEGIARIDMAGGCEGCGGGLSSMEGGLRLMLVERVAGLKEVVFE